MKYLNWIWKQEKDTQNKAFDGFILRYITKNIKNISFLVNF